ncbi:unnamed protein product [Mytilus coruscus]|uniref:Uncharacterized protein n=1 Tax=Mytilus coruscus TaxID=42192 RepID=A0A6J8BBX5_MYTCO|nr:unnamed protein product [Mytilus coruscus]
MYNTYRELYHVKSFRKRFFPLLKVVRSEAVIFQLKSTLIPPELQMEVENTQLVLHSTTFTQFLSFLCHYRLNNFSKHRESLRELQNTIEKPDRIRELTSKALSYICLGIAFQLHGDKDSADIAFLQAYELESCGVKEVALKRLRWLELLQHNSFNVK